MLKPYKNDLKKPLLKVQKKKKSPEEEKQKEGLPEEVDGLDKVAEWKATLNDEELAWWADPLRIGGVNNLSGKATDFITYYCDYMDSKTDASRVFKEASALFLISTLCKWNFSMWDHRRTNIWGDTDKVEAMPLNVWFFLIAKSGVGRKSTTIEPVKRLIYKITEKKTISKNIGRTKKQKLVCTLLPDGFTPEALVSTLNDRCWDRGGSIGKRTHAAWINDEISGFFQKLNKQDYMSGTAETLSKIYDCPELYIHETIKRGEEKIENPYLTLLVASTFSLPKLFTSHQLEQGFLNRPFYILDEKRDMKRIPIDEPDKRWKRIDKWLTALYDVKQDIKILNWNMEKKYDRFEKKVNDMIIKDDLGTEEGYYGRLTTFILKLASLYRISRLGLEDFVKMENRDKPDHEDKWDWRQIEEEDYQRALKFLVKCTRNFKRIIRMATMKTERIPIKAIDATVLHVYDCINDLYIEKGKPPSGSEIYNKLRNRIETGSFSSAIQSLVLGKNIKSIPVKTKGRPKIEYKPLKEPKVGGL